MAPVNVLALLCSLLLLTACTGHGHSHSHGDGQHHHHDHEHSPHDGVMEPFRAGQEKAGYVELKLHDDKGDLELWLTKDKDGKEPFDLPLNSVLTVTFPTLDAKTVELKIRNDKKNEDEDGQGNIREKKTNYFIFPGDTKADASFLKGKDFKKKVRVLFKSGGVDYKTPLFELRPHSHH